QERFGLAPGGPGAGPVVVGGPAGAAGTGDAGAAVPRAMGATAGAVTGGVAGGVPGGVPGGAVGGAIGGVPGGAAGGAAPGAGGGVGIVVDTLNIAEVERILIERALEVTGNNRTRAAELLGISVRTLRNRLNAPEA